MKNNITEPFGAVPRRLSEALAAREISFYEFSIIAWLEVNTNYNASPPVWRGTTKEMSQLMQWEFSTRYLNQILKRLHDAGWIESTIKPKSPKPYTIRLLCGAAKRVGDYEETRNYERSPSSQSLPTSSQSQHGAKGDGEGVPAPSRLEPVPSPQNTEVQRVIDVKALKSSTTDRLNPLDLPDLPELPDPLNPSKGDRVSKTAPHTHAFRYGICKVCGISRHEAPAVVVEDVKCSKCRGELSFVPPKGTDLTTVECLNCFSGWSSPSGKRVFGSGEDGPGTLNEWFKLGQPLGTFLTWRGVWEGEHGISV